jgi:hypothetical protein
VTLHYHQTTITPRELGYLHNVVSHVVLEFKDKDYSELSESEYRLTREVENLQQWISNVRHELWNEWKNLPDGDHLKEVYRDETWTWDDQDLYPPERPRTVSETSLLGDD